MACGFSLSGHGFPSLSCLPASLLHWVGVHGGYRHSCSHSLAPVLDTHLRQQCFHLTATGRTFLAVLAFLAALRPLLLLLLIYVGLSAICTYRAAARCTGNYEVLRGSPCHVCCFLFSLCSWREREGEGEGRATGLIRCTAPAHSCLNAAIDITRPKGLSARLSLCLPWKRLSLGRDRESILRVYWVYLKFAVCFFSFSKILLSHI